MVKPALYSRSPRAAAGAGDVPPADLQPTTPTDAAAAPSATAHTAPTGGPVGRPQPPAPTALPPAPSPAVSAPPRDAARPSRVTSAITLAALVLAAALGWRWAPQPRAVTQADIDAAVRESLEREPLPSAAARAYDAIAPSVVRVTAFNDDDARPAAGPRGRKGAAEPAEADDDGQRALDRSLGTGVVIVDNGTILTNLHVVSDARRLRVRFANGHESDAVVVGAQPENDLAVLKARSLPDDLQAATMRSTADLRPGDHVIAVGYPFGIGPSVSHGVVSGLRREFRAGDQRLTNLIQFDAAANPGNSGGPLVTTDGHVVGIVTAILNPSAQRTFIGIGFAVPIENAAAAAGMPPF